MVYLKKDDFVIVLERCHEDMYVFFLNWLPEPRWGRIIKISYLFQKFIILNSEDVRSWMYDYSKKTLQGYYFFFVGNFQDPLP